MPPQRSQETPGLLMQQALFTRTDAALLVIISGPMAQRCTASWRCWPLHNA